MFFVTSAGAGEKLSTAEIAAGQGKGAVSVAFGGTDQRLCGMTEGSMSTALGSGYMLG